MIIKKLLVDWKREYSIFWILTIFFIGLIASTEIYHGNKLNGVDIFCLVFLIVLFHIPFIGIQFAIENDKKRV